MEQEYKFCKHCGIRYLYVTSGCAPMYNDACYCTECRKAIVDALSKIPVRAGTRFVPCAQFSREEFVSELEKQPVENHKVYPGMCAANDNQIIKGIVICGTLYRATWWEKGYEPDFVIEREEYYEFPKTEKK